MIPPAILLLSISLLMLILLLSMIIIGNLPFYEINQKSLISRGYPAFPLWLIRFYNNTMVRFFWIPMAPINRFYIVDGTYTGFSDKKGGPIKAGDRAKTKDHNKKTWLGIIVLFEAKKVNDTYYLKENTARSEYNAIESKEELVTAFRSNYNSWLTENYSEDIEIIK